VSYYYYYYYYLLQFSCHSVAVVLTLVQTKQIRINIHKRNNTKTQYKQYKTQQIQVYILPKHQHITKQVNTTTAVQFSNKQPTFHALMLPVMLRVNRQAVTHSEILYRVMLSMSQPLRIMRRQRVELQITKFLQNGIRIRYDSRVVVISVNG
jgi:hypothetical protein